MHFLFCLARSLRTRLFQALITTIRRCRLAQPFPGPGMVSIFKPELNGEFVCQDGDQMGPPNPAYVPRGMAILVGSLVPASSRAVEMRQTMMYSISRLR